MAKPSSSAADLKKRGILRPGRRVAGINRRAQAPQPFMHSAHPLRQVETPPAAAHTPSPEATP